ncbi:MAG: carboxypeptidase regulatory-like domain-containing protein [Candidatus Omnitrophica bacterium]|nr:carboxypeptidase regulatory-like domain-containing protein [Candidatus Omnitrophota bacterium]
MDVVRPDSLGFGPRGHQLFPTSPINDAPDLFLSFPVDKYHQSISGMVRDVETGEPVPGVSVGFHPAGSDHRYGVLTDQEGRYQILAPPNEYGVYCVGKKDPPCYYRHSSTMDHGNQQGLSSIFRLVRQDWMERRKRGFDPHHEIVDLRPGQRVEGVDFVVHSARVLHGSVSDGEGNPVAGLEVNITLAERANAGPTGSSNREQVETDERGRFACPLPEWVKEDDRYYSIEISAVTRLPDHKGGSNSVVINRDDDLEVDLPIVLGECGGVEFQLVDLSGEAIPGATVTTQSLVDFPGSELSAGIVKRGTGEGFYRIDGLVPGIYYNIQTFADGYVYERGRLFGFMVEPGETIDAGVIVMKERQKVTGDALVALIEGHLPHDQYWGARLLREEGLNGSYAIPALIKRLSEYCEKWVRPEVANALGDFGPFARDAVPVLLRFAIYDDEPMKSAAIRALGNIGDPLALVPLKEELETAGEETRDEIVSAIRKIELGNKDLRGK